MKVVEVTRQRLNNSKIDPWKALREYYNVCIPSLATPLGNAIYTKFNELMRPIVLAPGVVRWDPFLNESYESMRRMPVVMRDGFRVIMNEVSRLEDVKAKEVQQQAETKAANKR